MSDRPATTRERPPYRGVRPLADIIGGALAPACRKRGFATVDLIAHWPDIVGPVYAETTAPERLSWQRKPIGVGDDEHEPALLTLRCSGGVALRLTHELPQVIERINMFFGYRCVGRIKVVQLPIPRPERKVRPRLAAISAEQEQAVRTAASGIGEDGLRQAVERLGRAVVAGSSRPITKS
ncbi:MAG TPA: DciA family protein [Methylomirabilota bacterium]|nr:DciA family protein [Methylomirabilota bacterium]